MTLSLVAPVTAKVFGLIDIRIWYGLTGGAIFLVTWLIRRFIPTAWAAAAAKSPALPQLWMMVLGALMSAGPALGKPLWDVVQQTLIGAILGPIVANGTHAFLKGMPGPYDGARERVQEACRQRSTPPDGLKTVAPPGNPQKP